MIKQIEYENKQAIQNDDSIANKNKVTAEDMNEIKNVVNQNAKELETLQEDNQGTETAMETLQNDISLIKQNNSEQDTNLQKNVKDIEANQNNIKALQVENAEVKAENERLRSDIESISLLGEAEGESIDLDDSSGARFKKFGVGGNHSQETREGYNIVDLTSFPKGARNGITATVDLNKGSITLNGTCTGTFAYAIPLALNAGTVVSYGLNNLQTNSEVTMRFEVTDNTQEGQISCAQKNAKMENFALTKDTVSWQLRIGKGTVLTDFVIYPQIEVGSTLHKFETYGATPSLDFTSEIKTVKDNINLTVANKNYINIENTSKTINGITFTVNSDGSILANGTATDRASYPIQNNFKKFEAGQYFVSGCPSGGSESTYYLILWNENWASMGSEYGKGKLVSLSNQKVKLHINIMKGTVCNNLLFKPQMEKGTKATDYEAHQEQAITMPVQQEMLKEDYFDFENEKQSNLFEKIVLNGVDKKCTASKAVGDGSEFQWAFTVAQSLPYVRTVYSNVAKLASDFGTVNGIRISANLTTAYVRSKIEVLNGKEATVENVNELLKTMYDNGNPAIFYIEKASNKELDFTDEQKAVAKKIKETLHTYKNITHIYSTDETSPIMNVEYAKDLNTQNNNLQNQIDEIKQLISTTQTSAMLLDNLQKEVESEVE